MTIQIFILQLHITIVYNIIKGVIKMNLSEKPERILTIFADKVDGNVKVGMIYKDKGQHYVKLVDIGKTVVVKDFEEDL